MVCALHYSYRVMLLLRVNLKVARYFIAMGMVDIERGTGCFGHKGPLSAIIIITVAFGSGKFLHAWLYRFTVSLLHSLFRSYPNLLHCTQHVCWLAMCTVHVCSFCFLFADRVKKSSTLGVLASATTSTVH